jgi:hypothetical protein
VLIAGEKESLFFGLWPRLGDGAVVLEEFAESGATKAAIGAWLFSRRGNEGGQMGFNVGVDAGSSAFKSMEAEELVGRELIIARGLEGNEFEEKGYEWGRLGATMVAAAGFDLKSLAVGASEFEVGRGVFFLHEDAGRLL